MSTTTARAYWTAEPTDLGRREAERPEPQFDVTRSGRALIDRLLRHDAPLVIEDPNFADRRMWRRAIHFAQTPSLVPDGMQLKHTGRSVGDLKIWLEPVPAERRTVVVPERVRSPHPLIAPLRSANADADGWVHTRHVTGCVHVRIHKNSVARAVRLLHGLVTACHDRGYEVRQHHEQYGCSGGLSVHIRGHGYEVVLIEETDAAPHVPTKTEQANFERRGWPRIPETDRVPSGRLRLERGHGGYQSTLATDRKRWKIEDRLGLALERLEESALEAEEYEAQRRRKAEEEERSAQLALSEARGRYVAAKREAALLDVVSRHATARNVRQFIHASRSVDLTEDATAWLMWAAAYADQIDPLASTLTPPTIPEPSAKDLQPFLAQSQRAW